MPLSPPAKRRHLHTRRVECFGYQREDGLFDIEGHIVDTKTYDCADMLEVTPAGSPIHDMWLRLTIDDSYVIHDVDAAMDARPYTTCPQVLPDMRALIGLRIGPGFKRAVKERIGGVKGCTHLVELIGPVATVAFQTMSSDFVAGDGDKMRAEPKRPHFLDGCHSWRTDGPVVEQRFPQFFTGSAPRRRA